MDRFTKAVLTVIAVALCVIAFRMPTGYATMGEMQEMSAMPAGPAQTAAAKDLRARLLLIRLQGGSSSVYVDNMPDR